MLEKAMIYATGRGIYSQRVGLTDVVMPVWVLLVDVKHLDPGPL